MHGTRSFGNGSEATGGSSGSTEACPPTGSPPSHQPHQPIRALLCIEGQLRRALRPHAAHQAHALQAALHVRPRRAQAKQL